MPSFNSKRRKPPKPRSHKRSLAIKPHNPRVRRILWASLTVVVVAAIAGAYFYGEYRGGYMHLAVNARHEQLVEQRDALLKTNADLRQQMVILQRFRKIDHKARQKVSKTNTTLQAQVVSLKKKLSFYNEIVAPGKVHSGARVQALEVSAGKKPDHYRYNLVLMQGPRHTWLIRGTVDLTVVGKQDSKHVTVGRKFKFRYFESLHGDLKLPSGFTPDRIEVTVRQHGRRDPFKRSFDWQVTG